LSGHGKVEIPLDYLIQTHVLMNASYEKMKELLGESVALAFFSMAADMGPLSKAEGYESVDALRSMLTEAGYDLTGSQHGDTVTFRLKCPHSDKIHPLMGEGASFCPMSQLVLAAIRAKYRQSVLIKSELERGGSTFTIEARE
jgi:hypothetical protein